MYCAESLTRMFAYRPYAIITSGIRCTFRTSSATTMIAAHAATVGHQDVDASSVAGASSTMPPAIAATTISTCCVCCVPIHATSTRLAPSDPTMAPTVLAAYTPPTSFAGSCPRAATAASASGKLAPQRMAAGSTANSARTLSTCRLIHGFWTADGLIGQYGSDPLITYAVHAMQTHNPTWHH